jgi:hypothetical protein
MQVNKASGPVRYLTSVAIINGSLDDHHQDWSMILDKQFNKAKYVSQSMVLLKAQPFKLHK